jgi:hypothetical protein
MTSIDRQQDRQPHVLPNCDHCGLCGHDERDESPCARRVPVLLMPPGMVDSLRAVERNTLALSQEDVALMDDGTQLELNF